MSNDLPSRRKPQNWTRERRARQSAIAKRKWAEKPAGLRGRVARLANAIDDHVFYESLGSIAVQFVIERMRVLMNMPKAKFIELAGAGGVDPKTAEAVRARLLSDDDHEEEEE